MPEALIQPQGYARLNPASRIAMAAHAIVLGSCDINLATGVPLGGSGPVQRLPVNGGVPFSFRFNSWRTTEVGPPIPASQASVEFWVGYPSAGGPSGAQNSGNPPPSFVTGSSSNQTGIYMVRGTGYDDGGNRNSWGYLTLWASVFNQVQDVLTPGQYTVLMVVRRPTSMEFWRDGRLVGTINRNAESIPGQSLICGAFITDNFWTTTSDTLLAGRALIDPTTDEVKAWCANPWMLFDESAEGGDIEALVFKQLRAALYMNGEGYIMPRPAGSTEKPLVLMPTGEIQQRATTEGLPIILDGTELRTLRDSEDLAT
jgi:hypothetical protein